MGVCWQKAYSHLFIMHKETFPSNSEVNYYWNLMATIAKGLNQLFYNILKFENIELGQIDTDYTILCRRRVRFLQTSLCICFKIWENPNDRVYINALFHPSTWCAVLLCGAPYHCAEMETIYLIIFNTSINHFFRVFFDLLTTVSIQKFILEF